MADVPFRVLSLDGGGIRGLFTAAFLAHIERYTDKRLADHFDLMVGTSTGSILALGLASGVSATDLLRFYEERGPAIFSGRAPWRQWLRPKYESEPLGDAIRAILGDATLNDLKVPVCVPSYEIVTGRPKVFKDDHHPDLHWGGEQPIWKVATASCAAPTFFPPFRVDRQDGHVDGGIWANNPVLVGIVEAIRYFGQPLNKVTVLSVGTAGLPFRANVEQARSWGMFGWGWKARVLTLVFDAQSSGAHETAKVLLGGERYLRVDASMTHSIPMDDYRAARPLIERGADQGRAHKAEVDRRFLQWPRASLATVQDG